jgi:hypothetical protein
MSFIVSYILARLGEASTYAGVAALLGGLFHFSVPATTLGAVTQVGIALAGALAVVLPASITGAGRTLK